MFSYITFWVSNSKQIAMYFVSQFGFTIIDYQGMEQGYTSTSTYILQSDGGCGGVYFIVKSCVLPEHGCVLSKYVTLHGDSIKDVAFKVDDCESAYHKAIERGAISVCKPHVKNACIIATIKTMTDITHTFVEGQQYLALDDFKEIVSQKHEFEGLADVSPCYELNAINKLLPPTNLELVDHVVTNTSHMEPLVQWYENVLDFHKFWSVDETQIHTEYSALRSTVMANQDETVKMPINEPAPGLRESQIQEYINYHGGSGVQHVALLTKDIITTVSALRQRGVDFLSIPKSYYDNLRARLAMNDKTIDGDLELIEKYNILVDFDEKGYLLQIFTKPITSRPTLFIEIIERHNFDGFGAGNFKALFECIEMEQAKRHTS
jgi:4-hydroxyphenylpyruvate dioxygenase